MQASQKPDFIRCYRILNLKPGCSWEQVRRQYKLLSQRWHPDRHPHDPSARENAEKKQRAINLAMRTIADYYKAHGRMPLRAYPERRHPVFSGDAVEAAGENESGLQKKSKDNRLWRRPLLAGALIMFAAWILWSSSEEHFAASHVPGGRMGDQNIAEVGKAPVTARFEFGDTREGVRAPPADADPFSSNRELIRIGSSYDDVSRIQGEPLFKTTLRWDYGPSYIEFRYGKVSGWHNSPMRPLRVKK